jgi:hypothetical protein
MEKNEKKTAEKGVRGKGGGGNGLFILTGMW